VAVGEDALARAFELHEELKDGIDAVRVELNLGGGSFKSQLKRADKSGALYALILGEDEIAGKVIGMKPLRNGEGQTSVSLNDIVTELGNALGDAD
jgi:histidyl-tRNA synthetase